MVPLTPETVVQIFRTKLFQNGGQVKIATFCTYFLHMTLLEAYCYHASCDVMFAVAIKRFVRQHNIDQFFTTSAAYSHIIYE